MILAVLAAVFLLDGMGSFIKAYVSAGERLGTLQPAQLRDLGGKGALDDLRIKRINTSVWRMTGAVFLLAIALGPYRERRAWSWWAVLIGLGVPQVLSSLQILVVGFSLPGVLSAATVLVLAVTLWMGAPVLRKPAAAA
jgi:hypothetical protein